MFGLRTLACAIVAALLALPTTYPVQAQPGGGAPTYQRKGTFAGGWQGHDRDRHRQRMPQFSSQTSAGSFQRPYPYHLDYYRARWGGSYAPYFGNLYGPPNFFFGSPFFGGFNPVWGFGSLPFAGFGMGFNGFGGSGFGGAGFGNEPFVGGAPYGPWQGQVGPWQGQYGPGMSPFGAPVDGGAMGGPGPGF